MLSTQQQAALLEHASPAFIARLWGGTDARASLRRRRPAESSTGHFAACTTQGVFVGESRTAAILITWPEIGAHSDLIPRARIRALWAAVTRMREYADDEIATRAARRNVVELLDMVLPQASAPLDLIEYAQRLSA